MTAPQGARAPWRSHRLRGAGGQLCRAHRLEAGEGNVNQQTKTAGFGGSNVQTTALFERGKSLEYARGTDTKPLGLRRILPVC